VRVNRPEIEMILAGSVAAVVSRAGKLCKNGPVVTKPYDHQVVLRRIRRLRAARDRSA
jgi:hypothetical protein